MEIEQAAAPELDVAAPIPAEVLVRFTTAVPTLRVPSVPISVPTSLTRSGLTKVIQHLLGGGASQHRPPPSAPGLRTRGS